MLATAEMLGLGQERRDPGLREPADGIDVMRRQIHSDADIADAPRTAHCGWWPARRAGRADVPRAGRASPEGRRCSARHARRLRGPRWHHTAPRSSRRCRRCAPAASHQHRHPGMQQLARHRRCASVGTATSAKSKERGAAACSRSRRPACGRGRWRNDRRRCPPHRRTPPGRTPGAAARGGPDHPQADEGAAKRLR